MVRIQLKSWTITRGHGIWVTFPWDNSWPSWSGVSFGRITNFGFLGGFSLVWLVFFKPRTFRNDSNLMEFYEHMFQLGGPTTSYNVFFCAHSNAWKKDWNFFQPSNEQFKYNLIILDIQVDRFDSLPAEGWNFKLFWGWIFPTLRARGKGFQDFLFTCWVHARQLATC